LSEQVQVILDTMSKTLSLVTEAEKARGSDESSFKLFLWKAAAEAEFLAFQISTAYGLADYDLGGKSEENVDPTNPLEAARSSLEEAKSSLKSDPKEAYRASRKAVSILRTTYADTDKPSKQRVVPSPRNE
jgi:hypothetical protein